MFENLSYGRPGLAIAAGLLPVANVAGDVVERTPPAATENPDTVLLPPLTTYTN
jgi:hypothetical protein